MIFFKLKWIHTEIRSSPTQIYAGCYLGCAFSPNNKFFQHQIKQIYHHTPILSSNFHSVGKHKRDRWSSRKKKSAENGFKSRQKPTRLLGSCQLCQRFCLEQTIFLFCASVSQLESRRWRKVSQCFPFLFLSCLLPLQALCTSLIMLIGDGGSKLSWSLQALL